MTAIRTAPDSDPPFLSIVLPAWNEEQRLPEALRKITAYLDQQPYAAEVLVVENGSTDRTTEIAEEYAARVGYVRVLHSPKGKGAAVHHGMLAGRGEYLYVCDTDLAVPIEEVAKFLPPQAGDYDVAIASREAPGATRHNEPFYRHLMGRVYNIIAQLIAVPGIKDTQCGFKCLRREAAREVFQAQVMSGWGFDVEVLFIARRRGYRIIEVPVTWYYGAGSRVSPLKDSLRMLGELWQVRRNGWRGMYDAES
ncbi:MAG TPA: dolichyl-phosphate beta-glucosyltransferase [Anaerolineae bacterium]|jgi:dolichyl-phosphate beta-glucosyltransferase|nr:dolichyl-phosphate beta-glucosyltransferase [Anaerolineae bacterium]